jgi:hypothetical protein
MAHFGKRIRPQDMVRAYHIEKVSPMETNHALRCKARTPHLALPSDNHHVFSKWTNIMMVISRARKRSRIYTELGGIYSI